MSNSYIYSDGPPFVPPPDNVTIPQFMFGTTHPARPMGDPKSPCIIDDESGKGLSLHELKYRSDALSKAMKARWNIGDNDVVCISSPNHLDYPVICWAAQQLGAIVATLNPGLTSQELDHQLSLTKPKLIFAHPTAQDAIHRTLSPKPDIVLIGEGSGVTVDSLILTGSDSTVHVPHIRFLPGEAKRRIAFLCFSSGTTGSPKAVSISHYNVICGVIQTATHQRINESYASWEDRRFRPGDTCSGVSPFYHIYGLIVNLHLVIFAAMRVVITARFNFEKMLQNIVRYRITHLFIVPPQALLFCKHPAVKLYDISHVRFCLIGAAPLSAELSRELLNLWPNVQLGQGYGTTETCGLTTFPTTQRCGTLGSAGQLHSGIMAKVTKEDGTIAKRGESGELWVKGDQVVLGYFNNENATRDTFIDGWARTGDEVLFADNGDLFVIDRIKEIMKIKGYQVSPSELEGHLVTHPDVTDVGVTGIPDEYAGELPIAFVTLTAATKKRTSEDQVAADILKADIMKHVSDAKSRYKWLKAVYFVAVIPRNPSGKILRRVLKQQAADIHSWKSKGKL